MLSGLNLHAIGLVISLSLIHASCGLLISFVFFWLLRVGLVPILNTQTMTFVTQKPGMLVSYLRLMLGVRCLHTINVNQA